MLLISECGVGRLSAELAVCIPRLTSQFLKDIALDLFETVLSLLAYPRLAHKLKIAVLLLACNNSVSFEFAKGPHSLILCRRLIIVSIQLHFPSRSLRYTLKRGGAHIQLLWLNPVPPFAVP